MALNLPTTNNIVLGAGYGYFDPLDLTTLLPTGETYMGDSPGFAMNVSTEKVEDYSSDGKIAELQLTVATRVVRAFDLNVKNMNAANLAIFAIATVGSQTTTAGAETSQAINGGVGVKQGRWYQLGVTSTRPTGLRNVSAVAIKHTSGTPTYVVDVDYKIDLSLARIYIIPGGGIADATIIKSDHTKANASWEEIVTDQLGARRGAFRFIADNTAGVNRDVFIPLCELAPNGTFAFKSRDTVQTMGFTCTPQDPGDGRARVYINGRAA